MASAHSAPAAPEKLPTCIPTAYRDADGVHRLAYPRSPWNPQRYLVVSCAAGMPDMECVHDDFGRLVPLRQRILTGDFFSQLAWRPVQ